ncbi:MAG: hypothetical protein OXE94_03625 [Aestuariivita sp.]|nr:hypothetical protein [Aestuariivita sp.]MCY4202743.1 hypothetical protein [Aestuariivita sp.]
MSKKIKRLEPHPIPEPVGLALKPSSYQPSKAETAGEFDMPGLSLDEIWSVFSGLSRSGARIPREADYFLSI